MPTESELARLIWLHDKACQDLLFDIHFFNQSKTGWTSRTHDMYHNLVVKGASLAKMNAKPEQIALIDKNIQDLTKVKAIAVNKGLA